ncbi:DUF1343 domain-containing protein [bacterium]|nr:DUF1343 domain-containing protein [bacterium]
MKYLFLYLFFSFSLSGSVLTGLDMFESSVLPHLKGKRVAVVTNITAVNKKGVHLLDVLKKHGVTVSTVFTPEHGFKADRDGVIKDKKGALVPTISLYGNQRRPKLSDLKKIDVVLYDIQDAGVRYYTYISTMVYMMQAVAKSGKKMVIIDRPNMVGADIVSGFVPPQSLTGKFTSIFPIATRYGMTNGELALLFNTHFGIKAAIKVVWMRNYNRSMLFDTTALPWISPSPNLTSLDGALLYSELGWLETVNLSMGRGTKTPFQLIGAPFIDAKKVVEQLRKLSFDGLAIESVSFTPQAKYHKYRSKLCHGVRITIKNRQKNDVFKFAVEFLKILVKHYPEKIKLSRDFALMTGSSELERMIRENRTFVEIESRAKRSRTEFRAVRSGYLHYK